MSRYGQYCPLALAAEVLCERWNLLILRRIIDGCRRFNDIHQGVPKISASLLSSRLQALEHAGLIRIEPVQEGRGHQYVPLPACQELEPISNAIAVWGQRWARDMTRDDLDPEFLLYSMHRRLDGALMPPGRTVIEFRFTGAPSHCNRFWLIHTDGTTEMCLKDPGYPEDVLVRSNLKRFIEAWRGIRDLKSEIQADSIQVDGPQQLVKAFPDWLMKSSYADTIRMLPGKESKIQGG